MSNVKVRHIYATLKVENDFKLKSHTSLFLVSNVVYQFACPCDMGKTYVGMSSGYLGTRARRYLNLNNSRKSATKDHLQQCKSCSESETTLHSSFTVLKKCRSEYNTKTHEALIIIQSKPLLNKQYMRMVVSFCKKYFNLFVLFRHNQSNYCICPYFVVMYHHIVVFCHQLAYS